MAYNITPAQLKAFAKEAGCSSHWLWQCLTGRRDMHPANAVRIEVISGGIVSRADLRKDAHIVWPELKANQKL